MRGDHRPEVVHPAAHGLVRDRDAALREQILDVTKAEREPEIEPNRLMYDLGREPISGVADFPHSLGYSAYLHPTSCRRRDKAGCGADPDGDLCADGDRLSAAGHKGEISRLAGREISRDVIASLKRHGLIDGAIRAPQPGPPFAYVRTRKFLEAFGLATAPTAGRWRWRTTASTASGCLRPLSIAWRGGAALARAIPTSFCGWQAGASGARAAIEGRWRKAASIGAAGRQKGRLRPLGFFKCSRSNVSRSITSPFGPSTV
jgi:hypothetical protein